MFAHEKTSLSRLLGFLNRTKRSLDICVFTITCNDISDTIAALWRRGVAVRIITDRETVSDPGSDISG
jgi:cardiolipin hydrolase